MCEIQETGQRKQFLTITDRFISSPVAKLRPGSVLQGKVVQVIGKGKILIELLNREIIAKTNLNFKEGEQLKLWVKKQGTPIILEVLGKSITKSGIKNLLPLLTFLNKFAFNPLSETAVKDFKEFVESKKFFDKLFELIARNPEQKEELFKALSQLSRDENYFYIPICFLDKNILIKGKMYKHKSSTSEETTDLYLSLDTVNMGIIEVHLSVLENKKRINILFFTSTEEVANFIASHFVELSHCIHEIGFIPGKFKASVISGDVSFFKEEAIEVLA